MPSLEISPIILHSGETLTLDDMKNSPRDVSRLRPCDRGLQQARRDGRQCFSTLSLDHGQR
jgi:hypothetical protein